MPRGLRRQYDQVPSVEGDDGADNGGRDSRGPSVPDVRQQSHEAVDKTVDGKGDVNYDDDDDDKSEFDVAELPLDDSAAVNVVILDTAQKRFPLRVDPDWNVLQLKRLGQKTHKVAPAQQRLIYRGKLLADDAVLRSCGITEHNTIIHLFPKPRVVVTSASSSATTTEQHEPSSQDGAHIPQIVLDQDEAERRGQILVLGSHEVAEAQNNVKLLSLLLLVFCSMRLLTLFSIAMGIAEESASADGTDTDNGNDPTHSGDDDANNSTFFGTDDIVNPSDSATALEPRIWETHDYFDLVVSAIGFYVATLGMKATNENTLSLAQSYLVGTIVAGISWNAWNIYAYVDFVVKETAKSEEQDPNEQQLTRDDFVTVAFFMVLLPLLIWVLCCFRAWEFRNLLQEAEDEAAERIRSQLQLEGDNDTNDEASHEMTTIHPERTPIV